MLSSYGESSHYNDVIMGAMASQITSLTIVYSTVYSGIDQSKHQSSASMASVRGIHQWPVNSPHKGPVTRRMFPFDEVIMESSNLSYIPSFQLHVEGNTLQHEFIQPELTHCNYLSISTDLCAKKSLQFRRHQRDHNIDNHQSYFTKHSYTLRKYVFRNSNWEKTLHI